MVNKNKPEYIPPDINPKKIQTEQQSRINVLNIAKGIGQLEAAKEIFAKYDRMLSKYEKPDERHQIAVMGAAEVYRLLGFKDGLRVGDQVVFEEDIDYNPTDDPTYVQDKKIKAGILPPEAKKVII
jgi:hypothetical protein